MSAQVQTFFDQATNTASYLVSDPATKAAVIIDPVLDYDPRAARTSTEGADRMVEEATRQGLDLQWVLETHAHADHLTAAKHIAEKTGAKIGIGAFITKVQDNFAPLFGVPEGEATRRVFDHLFEDGESFSIGSLQGQVMHTPGHTPACVSYLIDDAVFVGDTLFMPDYGTARADFPGGDARTLFRSIGKLLDLPGETRMFVGHDYLPKGRKDHAWETTVAAQREGNIHVGGGVSEDDFVAMREARDATLAVPKLILPSLQVNIRGGALPQPDKAGQVYLKLPVNRL